MNRLLSTRGWRAAWAWGIVLAAALRLGLGLWMGAVWVTLKPYLPADRVADPGLYGDLPMYTAFPGDALLGVWVRWDAVHYLNLARLGYFGVSKIDSGFFPLYPSLTHLVSWVTGGDYVFAGLVMSTLTAAATFAGLHQLANRQYGAETARWTVIALAVYPTAIFLVAPYTEGLFLALTLGAFLAAYERRWWWAGGLSALAGLTRGQGILTTAALGWIAWEQWRRDREASPRDTESAPLALSGGRAARRRSPLGGRIITPGLGLVLSLSGGLAYLAWRQAAGLMTVGQMTEIYALTNPLLGLWYALWQWSDVHDLQTTLDVFSTLAFLGLTAAMLVQARWRRAEWLIYVGLNLMAFTTKRNLVASSLQSNSRYVLTLFPAFIVIGDWLARQKPGWRFAYLSGSSALLLVFSALYALWWFIG